MNDIDRGKWKYWGEGGHVPVPLCSPQIPHILAWDRTQASSIRIVYRILARKPERKRPLQKSISRWQDDIKWNLSKYIFLMYLMPLIYQMVRLMAKR
jgi:hypothetical protein